ncbi:hypothetical protein [Neorhizobium huautlense]|uniref:hypothetical protein n=1 Tax=Neorhizobium huautlense TaxID=67774 RepID=UPI000CF8B4F6|nr:hypothetical protein [Neorhizobium huautlense]
MISYRPIQFDLGAGATAAELGRLEMTCRKDVGANELEAYFTVSGEDHLLRVFFHHVDIFRVIDDVHLPLEEHGQKTVGHVPNYFAHRVEGSPFWAAQREVLAVVRPGSTHYRFVTGGNCLDVISPDEPSFSWVS